MLVERVVRIVYDTTELACVGPQAEAFQKALGRMVMHGMTSDTPRTLEVVTLGIDRGLEITGAYHTPWKLGDSYVENGPYYTLMASMEPFYNHPFVMGGVPRDGGAYYSFHS